MGMYKKARLSGFPRPLAAGRYMKAKSSSYFFSIPYLLSSILRVCLPLGSRRAEDVAGSELVSRSKRWC
jgi:hypothetical protein